MSWTWHPRRFQQSFSRQRVEMGPRGCHGLGRDRRAGAHRLAECCGEFPGQERRRAPGCDHLPCDLVGCVDEREAVPQESQALGPRHGRDVGRAEQLEGDLEQPPEPPASLGHVEVERREHGLAVAAGHPVALHRVAGEQRPAGRVEVGAVAPGVPAGLDHGQLARPHRDRVPVPEQHVHARLRTAQAGQEVPGVAQVHDPRIVIPETGPLLIERLHPGGVLQGCGDARAGRRGAPGALAAGVIRVPVRGEQDVRLTGSEARLPDGRGERRLPGTGDARIDQAEAAGAREQVRPQRGVAHVGVVRRELVYPVPQVAYLPGRSCGGHQPSSLPKISSVCSPRSGTPRWMATGVAEKTNGEAGVRNDWLPSPIGTSQNMPLCSACGSRTRSS